MLLRFATLLPLLAGALNLAGCGGADSDTAKRLQPVYDAAGKLQLLKYDSNSDGKLDTWSYMDGATIVRIEIDKDGDGVVDRWEHYNAARQLERVGASRLNDGKEDTWFYSASDGSVARAELSTRRDGKISRIEHYADNVLAAAEEDVDGNGAMDKWETYSEGRLASVAFDTTNQGRPDRRLVYAADGRARLEIDARGSGDFVPVKDARSNRASRGK
jgi:hypothetical protein